MERKSKKLHIYQDKKTGSIFLNPTKVKNGRFITKSPPKDYGDALSGKVSDVELGKAVKKALKECD